uniref:Uncharacterized protein n=1 Tax=Glossina pallidipes TaxID=7398 RepID=A0A1A9Z2F3_GLOPL
MASVSSMEVSDDNFVKLKPSLRQAMLAGRNEREQEKEADGIGKKRKSVKDCAEELGDSSTSSAATITSSKPTKRFARTSKDSLKCSYINRFKEESDRLYEQIFKLNKASASETKPLLTIANDHEKILIELIQENARLSGPIEGLEKAVCNQKHLEPVNLLIHSARASLPLSEDAKISVLSMVSVSLSDKNSLASTNSWFFSMEKFVGLWSSLTSIFDEGGSAALNLDSIKT